MGGVSANDQIRKTLEKEGEVSSLNVFISPRELTGDNALMIGAAAYVRLLDDPKLALSPKKSLTITATGNLRLSA